MPASADHPLPTLSVTLTKLTLCKSTWDGNRWPSIDIHPYEDRYFLFIVSAICAHLNMAMPSVVDILDGYACDLAFEGKRITVMQDNWTCSVASESEHIRDRIYGVLEAVDI